MSNYRSLRDFSYEITGDGGSILDAIIKGYVKYYIDEGVLTCSSESAIISIAESAVYTLKEFLGIVIDKCSHEYTNLGVGTVHKMKYSISTKDIKIDTYLPIEVPDVLDLRVSGLLSHMNLFIPLTPEIEGFNESMNDLSIIEINNNVPKIIELVNKVAGEDATMERISDVSRLFGIDHVDFTVPDFDNKKLIMLVVDNITSEITNVSNDKVETEEKVVDEVIVNPVPLEAKADTMVGHYHIVKQVSHPSKTIAGETKGEYTVADGGVFGKIIDIAAFNYINIEKEQKDKFKKPHLSDALKVAALATTVFWDFIDDITAEGYPLLEGCKFDIRTTLTPDEYNPVFIDIEGSETNEYKFGDDILYHHETELFERVADCISCTCNQFDYQGDEVYDEYMLKTLGVYIGYEFGLPIMDYIEEVRQKIEAVQDEIKSALGI